ncbi:MAG: hypothetical protein ABFS09_07680 [Thermodesulfobacteriota bacterium]
MTPPSEKKTATSHDPLTDLDDDLGDDWESAFQAEDFMFSPEEESADFFLLEDTPDDNDDISGLFNGDEGKKGGTDGAAPDSSGAEAGPETSTVLEFPSQVQILAASLLQLFQNRPLPQRLLIGALPIVLILIISSTQFFRSTNDEFASLEDQALVTETQITTTQPQERKPEPGAKKHLQTIPAPGPVAEVETVHEKWKLPSFIIVAKADNNNNLVINIDLTLIAKLEKGQDLPAEKTTFVKDVIYQFYANRPAYELKRFALARGEMISQLKAWLNKQWQNNPIDTITFSHYQVIQTSPPLAPKVTFM